MALAQAKAEIRALVERDFNRKTTHGRKRHARFLEDHTSYPVPPVAIHATTEAVAGNSELSSVLRPAPALPEAFSDDEVLPVFEANFDLPTVPIELHDSAETCN